MVKIIYKEFSKYIKINTYILIILIDNILILFQKLLYCLNLIICIILLYLDLFTFQQCILSFKICDFSCFSNMISLCFQFQKLILLLFQFFKLYWIYIIELLNVKTIVLFLLCLICIRLKFYWFRNNILLILINLVLNRLNTSEKLVVLYWLIWL